MDTSILVITAQWKTGFIDRLRLWEDLLADIFKEEGAGVRVVLITMRV